MSDRADPNALLARLLDEAEAAQTADQSSPSEQSTTPPPSSPPATDEPVAAGGLSPLLGGLLSNPALLSALPTLVENLSPLLSGGTSGGSAGSPSGGTSAVSTGHHLPIDRHTALICAIKPYLSSERQAAAETIIRLCRVWDTLSRSGISLSGLLGSAGGAPSVSDRKEVT